MRVKLLTGKIVDAKIKKAPITLTRQYGFTKMAHWQDKDTGMFCSVPVKRNFISKEVTDGYIEI